MILREISVKNEASVSLGTMSFVLALAYITSSWTDRFRVITSDKLKELLCST